MGESFFNYEQARNGNQNYGEQPGYTVADHEEEVYQSRIANSGVTVDELGRDARERQNDDQVESIFRGKKPDHGGQDGSPEGSLPGPVDKNRIRSDTPYKIFGSEETKDGTRVYVDQYPTQKTDEDAKRYWRNHYGNLVGVPIGAVGAAVGLASPGTPVQKGFNVVGNASAGYELGHGVGSWVTGKVIDNVNPSMPVLEQDGKKIIKVTP